MSMPLGWLRLEGSKGEANIRHVSQSTPTGIPLIDIETNNEPPSSHHELPRPAPVLEKAPSARGPAVPIPEVEITPNELEMSRPPSPKQDEASAVVQTWRNPSMNRYRILTICLIQFANGFNDSAPGALLPYIEQHYHVDYTIVSMIFIANAIGFLTAAFFVTPTDLKLGRARTLMLCEAIVACGYIIMVSSPPFAVFAIAYFITGYGMATTLALNNVFTVNLAASTVLLGFMHGSYGLGGLLAPIVATAMVTARIPFSRFYALPLALRMLNLGLAAWSFRGFEADTPRPGVAAGKRRMLATALRTRATLLGALFIFAYQGAEVSISGWVISFLISVRGGAPDRVGYVTAGFWGGITAGRLGLSVVGARVGEVRAVWVLVGLTAAMQMVVWFAESVVGDALAVAVLGLLLGPVYPCATSVLSKRLDRSVQSTAFGFISSAGSSGGAVAPFVVGVLAGFRGTWVLHPVCVACYAVMAACWAGLGSGRKRRE